MQNSTTQQYGGYTVRPSAHCLPDGLFSANLLLERNGARRSPNQYEFFSLDYFVDEADAVDYARSWACHWIDTRG
ncbi:MULTISPECIES: hypothetical protein [Paraburkholderia]|jgi:hypothetical protein|uniref:Uncharacterized protein n=2 Tax=Paraburkholderia caribensis TaxID=75105 RepID=A0A9Q6S6A4_9BURK|nr:MULTISPECIES: hypothetical protein [Paraburkholderia]ALL67381.1 hypothetical protein K788_0005452 [Paraburkholderia caribensis MBA4]ALP64859.1 hypothetical protein AN416_19735 [Paraburkholderia caribensis]AMV44808.1 hypothetical protein ATN79_22970 [Paraburkholderia caribensis]AUT53993.1 hypothetical protein C2L66_18815 [Paraburkholderia caribensis]MCO4876854.1 hypothetical protein [Paraburkholderia caribensis]